MSKAEHSAPSAALAAGGGSRPGTKRNREHSGCCLVYQIDPKEGARTAAQPLSWLRARALIRAGAGMLGALVGRAPRMLDACWSRRREERRQTDEREGPNEEWHLARPSLGRDVKQARCTSRTPRPAPPRSGSHRFALAANESHSLHASFNEKSCCVFVGAAARGPAAGRAGGPTARLERSRLVVMRADFMGAARAARHPAAERGVAGRDIVKESGEKLDGGG